jgi:hypothetical protein
MQHPQNHVRCGKGGCREADGCSSGLRGPPARCQPTVAIQVVGATVAAEPIAAPGARCQPGKCGPELRGSTPAGARKCFRRLSQHVDHAGPHLPRCRERTHVVAIADDLPLRPRTRLTASASRIASPCMPPRARRASSPSTIKCPWFCWMEKWITRKRSTDARPMARRSAPNTRVDLSDGSPGAARIVT